MIVLILELVQSKVVLFRSTQKAKKVNKLEMHLCACFIVELVSSNSIDLDY